MSGFKMIRNPPNRQFLGGVLDPFHQKHIILTLLTRHFDTQLEKAYHFCARTALK